MPFFEKIATKLVGYLIVVGCAFSFVTPMAKADDLLNRVSGSWTTYNVRVNTGVMKWSAYIAGGKYTEEFEFNVFIPLFQKEGVLIKSVCSNLSATKYDAFPDAIDVKGKLESVWMKFKSKDSVAENNAKSYCGFSNWQVGVYKNVTGKICKDTDDDDGDPMPNVGDEMEHVYVFQEGNVFTDIGFDETSPLNDDPNTPTDLPDDLEVDFRHPIFNFEK